MNTIEKLLTNPPNPYKMVTVTDSIPEKYLNNQAHPHRFSVESDYGCYLTLPPRLKINCQECKFKTNFSLLSGRTGFDAQEIWSARIGKKEYISKNAHCYYRCDNCSKITKSYSMRLVWQVSSEEIDIQVGNNVSKKTVKKSELVKACKFGEFPPFGEEIPPNVRNLLSKDSLSKMKKGLASENDSFGAGALTYYRQVIDESKEIIFDKLIQAARLCNAVDNTIEFLEKQKSNPQFKSSFTDISLPDRLMIQGENPLLILYKESSIGIHAKISDEESLLKAQQLRIFLYFLIQRIDEVIKEDKEMHAALQEIQKKIGSSV